MPTIGRRQFTPPHRFVRYEKKTYLRAEQTSWTYEQTAGLYVYQEIPILHGVVYCGFLRPVPSALLSVFINILVYTKRELQVVGNNNHVCFLRPFPDIKQNTSDGPEPTIRSGSMGTDIILAF